MSPIFRLVDGPMRRLRPVLLAVLLIPAVLRAQSLDEAMKTVEKIRGTTFTGPVQQKTISRTELRSFLLDEIRHSAGSAEDYVRVLEAMQLVDRDPQLIERLIKLYEAQVLAFYDPKKHVYYSLDEPPPGLPAEALMQGMVTVHELVHALQDQRFGVGARIHEVQKNWERELAYHSVIEGEATLVMMDAMISSMGMTLSEVLEQGDMVSAMSKAAAMSGMPEDAPRFFVESMKFPYLDGLRFVIAAYQRGGWKAVDQLHEFPPMSTEEIAHPEQYAARIAAGDKARPQAVTKKSAYFTTELGEFFWSHLLGEQAGVGSDVSTFTLERRKEALTATVESSWDTERDAREFEAAYRSFLEGRGLSPEVRRQGKTVQVVYRSGQASVTKKAAK